MLKSISDLGMSEKELFDLCADGLQYRLDKISERLETSADDMERQDLMRRMAACR